MMYALRRFMSRAMALALLAAVLFLAFALLIQPFLDRFLDVRERIASERQLLGRLSSAGQSDGNMDTEKGI